VIKLKPPDYRQITFSFSGNYKINGDSKTSVDDEWKCR